MNASGPAVGSAALRLTGGEAAAHARLELAERYAAGDEPLLARLAAAAAWPALEDFLLATVRERRPTLVYGDYDVDGSAAAFMMFRWLRQLGVPCNVFLPSRFKHGYGLDAGVISHATEQGYAQLLALDCGTANLAEIEQAREQGLGVAVIDHHAPQATLPPALLLNPHTAPQLPPLCTAGLVYAVLRRLEQLTGSPPAADLAELAGLATLADVVPLEPDNWALAHFALRRIPRTRNLGLSELAKAARLDGLDRLTSRQAAFSLVPRLNAAGRMANARLVVELFGAPDRESARSSVQRLEQLNAERKAVTERVEAEAVRQALELGLPAALALYSADWHPGVLGIVAARVAERFGRPVAILASAAQGGGLLAGSVRAGLPGVNALSLLRASAGTLASYGGHAQAAGLKLEQAALESFRAAFAAAAADELAAPVQPAAAAPIPELALCDITAALESDLWALAPFGPDWPAPRVRLMHCQLLRASYMGADKLHASLTVTDGKVQARLAAFNQSHLLTRLRDGQPLAPLVELEPDNWNNRQGLLLRLLALD